MCGKSSHSAAGHLVIAVDVPVTGSPYIAQTIHQGVELATSNLNGGGGLRIGSKSYLLKVKLYDNHLSARTAVEDTRRALDAGAVTIVTDGTGVDATWQLAKRAGVSIAITHDGGTGLVDAETRPNVFRIAPTNHGIAFRYAEYLIPKKLKVGLLSDDSAYGREGAADIGRAFSDNPEAVALKLTLPAGPTDLTPQILRARRSGATALLVWGQPPTIASVLSASRSIGWKVPVYTPPTGSDPFIRQQLADHPDWVDGLTFAGGRLTAEVGTGPFVNFQSQYESTYGADQVGVKNSQGQPVVQPPEFAMYSYDFVHVLVAAIAHAASVDPDKVTAALNQVTTQGANGDERGFNEHSHEGVVDDDVYFARFHDMTYQPVPDDPLSATLPQIPQTRGAMRRALLVAVAVALLAPAAALADVQQVLLPGPTPYPTPSPPLHTVAAALGDADRSRSTRAPISACGPASTAGRVVAVRALQRLHLTGTGDYLIVVSAPVLDVGSGSRLAVRARPTARPDPLVGLLVEAPAARRGCRLSPRPVRPHLPLRLEARRDGDRYELTVTNTTRPPRSRSRAPPRRRSWPRCSTAPATTRSRTAACVLRTSRSTAGSRSGPRSAIAAPFRVEGELRFPSAPKSVSGGTLDGRTVRFSFVLGDRQPLTRRIEVDGGGEPHLDRDPARRCRPRAHASGRRAHVERGGRAAPARAAALLERLVDTRMQLVRADQFQGFLSNPDQLGRNRTDYVYETAAAAARGRLLVGL